VAGAASITLPERFEIGRNTAADCQRVERKRRSHWLVANWDFRHDLVQLREKWQTYVQDHGFPCPEVFLGQSLGRSAAACRNKRSLGFLGEFEQLRSRWSLSTMLTWELPFPWPPNLGGTPIHDPLELTESGITLFLPWHALRTKSLPIRDFAVGTNIYRIPKGMRSWIAAEVGGLGPRRYQTQIRLYVYLELAIRVRYGDRLSRRMHLLDQAFSRFLGFKEASEDSVKKIRLAMNRELAGATSSRQI